MEIKREIIDNSTNSPRLQKLEEYLDQWMNYYNNTDEPGIDMFLIGYDKKYNHKIKLSLSSKDNPRYGIFNAINKGLGKIDDQIAKDIFDSMCQYIANLIVTYPNIEKTFNENIKRMKEHELERKNK